MRKLKLQRPCAETADGPGRNFNGPNSSFVDAKFRVDGPGQESKRVYAGLQGIANGVLLRFRKTRRRHINRFFEVWTFQQIRFVEDRQDAKRTLGDQRFDGYFPSWEI